ncbi:MAG: tRNA methyltransferase [Kordiimonas sp.]|mgnify:CR=1 FL=1|nr:tRNA methyltransferase [Kordiimonas sp.]|tara:strand:+ start:3106 stop:3582 length:477 start_codon:yes stop_codon:yes gene_type:complete
MQMALYQPDIPQNTGTLIRLSACLSVPLHVIEPCGFPFGPQSVKRAAMDYLDHVRLTTHLSWDHFISGRGAGQSPGPGRLVLLTTKTDHIYTDFTYQPDDILLLGRESAGVPDDVHDYADAAVTIPMRSGMRSLNVAMAAAMVLGEALRQTEAFSSNA